jgi:prepilin-type N-terminal cleavage/methylation domain-containing protein
MKPSLFSNRGATLIELMIALAIASTIVGLIGQTYVSTAKSYIYNREMFQTQMRSLLSIDYISQELRNAGYIVNWDATPDAPPLAINQAITGAVPDANTESITLRYAIGPLSGAGAQVATLNGAHNAGAGTTLLTVLPLTFAIPAGTLVAIYSPPTTVNVRRTAANSSIGATTISLTNAYTSNFSSGSIVAPVQEVSFWVQGGNLWMRTGGSNQQLAGNVDDLQVVLINSDQSLIGDVSSAGFAGLTTTQLFNARSMRVSLTARSVHAVVDKSAVVPPSLEDHNRSADPADKLLRRVQQTTVYLRNFGALDP